MHREKELIIEVLKDDENESILSIQTDSIEDTLNEYGAVLECEENDNETY